MKFVQIQTRLLSRIRELIHNGELTQRGFARLSGISQPHIHKVLKGERTLSAARFDLLLRSLDWSLLDLFEESEIRNHLARGVRPRCAWTDLPWHDRVLGPGVEKGVDGVRQERYPVPRSLLASPSRVVLVRLKHDAGMQETLGNCNVGVLELPDDAPVYASSLYAVDRGQDTVIRRVRQGASCLYLICDIDASNPLRWEAIPPRDALGRAAIRGRLVWLGEETYKKPARREYGQVFHEATSSYVSRT